MAAGFQNRGLHRGCAQVTVHNGGGGEIVLKSRTGVRVDVRRRDRFKPRQPESFRNAAGTCEKIEHGRRRGCMHSQS